MRTGLSEPVWLKAESRKFYQFFHAEGGSGGRRARLQTKGFGGRRNDFKMQDTPVLDRVAKSMQEPPPEHDERYYFKYGVLVIPSTH